MSLRKYLSRIRRLDALIRRKSTGPPEELADRLDISERWLYKFLRELKEEFDCPITYDHYKQSYVYEEQGKIIVGFEELTNSEEKQFAGGQIEKIESLYLFLQ
ncbi:hypothetical protein NC796_00480 [Aliifodinibius sp. S!AR15-10]|uniref:hypothetical protein n=1 Tax=Aliifodinibius sp. S!AR15-10 TaxID=2950437 RepID=UPI002861EE53|nr:hypothetical protein [Aliifodinibius sp. S!AR15-10]MDR8389589.1 hypothetical protein [Aliifodinibius sp. S!AR15-10]